MELSKTFLTETNGNGILLTGFRLTEFRFRFHLQTTLTEFHRLCNPLHAAAPPALTHASTPTTSPGCSSGYGPPTVSPGTLCYTWQQRTIATSQTDGTCNGEHVISCRIPFPAHGKSPTTCTFLTWPNSHWPQTSTKSEPSPSTA